ncbi:MAG: low affinity iron permease family protein, partial [Actinomycetes bacterium]
VMLSTDAATAKYRSWVSVTSGCLLTARLSHLVIVGRPEEEIACYGMRCVRFRDGRVSAMSRAGERPAAHDRDRDSRPSPFERFVEAAHLRVSRPPFFFICVALIVVWLVSVPVWADLKEWQVAIHTVTSVITLLLIALLENAGRRSEEAAQEKLNMLAEAMVVLMESQGDRDPALREAAAKLSDAIGLEARH